MAASGPWGAIAQSEGIANDTGAYLRRNSHPQASSESDDPKNEEEDIVDLARQFTQCSAKTGGGSYVNPFGPNNDPELDPMSGQFSQRKWVKTMVGITSRDPERYPERVAGIAFRNLSVHGFGNPLDYQKTFGNYPLEIGGIFSKVTGRGKTKIQILRDFDGLVKSGEMLVVLGRPGSGCTTLLKTLTGETGGFFLDPRSTVNYQGIPMEIMQHDFRGECIYQAETDVHFPQLTVGQTLQFAAEARTPSNRLPGVTRKQYAVHMRDVIMATFGLTHTMHTRVGNDFVRGVSGGERKRVSIAEAALGGSPIQAWDNSTRGLDSSTALEFVKTVRLSTDLLGCAAIVAIYQASQSIYDQFDKVTVLYEGRQIYFGQKDRAKEFFIGLGFSCPDRQTTGDFLTSLTNPAERVVREGFETKVPRTPDEFAAVWKNSEDRAQLLREIEQFEKDFPIGGEHLEAFRESRRAMQSDHQRLKSPYTISVSMQVKLCIGRGFQRVRGDMSLVFTNIFGNAIMALIIGSIFYNLPDNTGSFYSRGALLFFAILLNAFSAALEILTLYAQRSIVEKQAKYAFYHPYSEAIASMICDLPNKIITSLAFNLTLYFLTNLRRTPSAFFIFYLFSFVATLTMSMIFRSIGAISKSLAQAMAPAAIFILALVIYTGFTLPISYMHPWFRWLNYLDPIGYAFEALMINEFRNRQFPCSVNVPSGPGYENVSAAQRACSAVGAAPGANFVDGDVYIGVGFQYYAVHLWRNLGILFVFMILFLCTYLYATEYIASQQSKGEVLLFRRGQVPKANDKDDEEANIEKRTTATSRAEIPGGGGDVSNIHRQTAIFHWDSVSYEIKIKGNPRVLLDDVDGWVKPGTLTALMGASGAGKTTLLDVLASRVTMGVVTGHMYVNGRDRDSGFQRKTGYVQQQDLHLHTTTVREALQFSALLRQPKSTPGKEKLEYVEEVIQILEMESYADAIVGVPGEGLNVEQRKRLTIAVEMAAKPDLLLFLDEPTSGLDSQTAWSICILLRKLAANGQAILCTIHQPSAILFQQFDRLLFLASGGRTVYYGDIGENSKTLTSYFERNGSRECGVNENPAEWMLDVIGAAPGSQNKVDWPQKWRESEEKKQIKRDLAELKAQLSSRPTESDPASLREFAAPLGAQLYAVTKRVFQQYWRTPSYLYSKSALCLGTGLFIGFSFWQSPLSLQGLQNQLFSVFMLMTVFGNLLQQIMPHFVTQRALYEVRERPSKTYSWKVFMISNILVELPWQTLMAVLIFFSSYYPIGYYKNAIPTGQVAERGGLMFLYIWMFLIFTSTFTDMIIAGMDSAETAGNVAQLMFSLCLIFCGVLASPTALPGFWIFMYRVSPFTYIVEGMLATAVANTQVTCSDVEYAHFSPPSGQSCGEYMKSYISFAGGYLSDPDATTGCQFCPVADTNVFLASVSASYSHRWRNFGILWIYVIFNIVAALFLYWLARVPKKTTVKAKKA